MKRGGHRSQVSGCDFVSIYQKERYFKTMKEKRSNLGIILLVTHEDGLKNQNQLRAYKHGSTCVILLIYD